MHAMADRLEAEFKISIVRAETWRRKPVVRQGSMRNFSSCNNNEIYHLSRLDVRRFSYMMNSTNGFLTASLAVKASMPPNPFFGKTRRIPEEVVAPPKMQRSDHSDPRSIVVVTENKIEETTTAVTVEGVGLW